jgi:hypothetical protein
MSVRRCGEAENRCGGSRWENEGGSTTAMGELSAKRGGKLEDGCLVSVSVSVSVTRLALLAGGLLAGLLVVGARALQRP